MGNTELKSQKSYSPGLEGVIAGPSQISEIDPRTDHLTYRGYDIHELTKYSVYEEVAYLLLFGTLPKKDEFKKFLNELILNRPIPQPLLEMFKQFPSSSHPMDLLRTGVSMLSVFDPDRTVHTHDANLKKAIRLIAQFPTLVAASFRLTRGEKVISPLSDGTHAENFIYMMKGKRPDAEATRIFDRTLMIYAEHGFNASTFSSRVTASTLSDMHSAITSGIGTLKGSLHGGANEEAMKMILEIGEPSKAKSWIDEALVQKRKIMGFGHREYKKGDPRARLLKPFAESLGKKMGQTKWMEISEVIEKVMLKEKNLYPNVDFPAAVVFYLLGFPTEIYTPIFALARIAGWSSHVIEQLDHNRLIRPECEYTGKRDEPYIPIEQR
ncbi:MAG: citrate synthase [Chlamydiae bacterium]|nr:citrate synthase [Chlamydiota bacterium]MBI3276172.1 citrate synthase [Chlamydiota bacterium]